MTCVTRDAIALEVDTTVLMATNSALTAHNGLLSHTGHKNGISGWYWLKRGHDGK
ncbi:MAG: hypothetical protein V4461_06555 [Pseudomonadota bacterium]